MAKGRENGNVKCKKQNVKWMNTESCTATATVTATATAAATSD